MLVHFPGLAVFGEELRRRLVAGSLEGGTARVLVFFFCDLYDFTSGDVRIKILILHTLAASFAPVSPSFTSLKMFLEFGQWHSQVAILASLGFHDAVFLMLLEFGLRRFLEAVGAGGLLVELFLMVGGVIDVEHVGALFAFLHVAAAVGKMSGYLAFRDFLQTIFTLLVVLDHRGLPTHRFICLYHNSAPSFISQIYFF